MKNRAFKTLIAAAVVASVSLGLLGLERTVQAQDQPAVSQPDPMQFARGAQTWADNCARCHNMRDPNELRDDQWRAVVSHMRVRGGLTGLEARDVLAFLQGSN
jgi:mono/diheme cytochrome c family protein